MIKRGILAGAVALALSTVAASAADVDSNKLEVTAHFGDFRVGAEKVSQADTLVVLGFNGLEHQTGLGQGFVDLELKYDGKAEEAIIRGEYQLLNSFDRFAVVVAPSVEYHTETEYFYFDPYVKGIYSANATVDLYGKLGATWNMSENWDTTSTYTEIGLDYAFADNISMVPYVKYDFESEATQVGLELHMRY